MNIISILRSITVDSELKRLRRSVNMHAQCLIYGFPAKHAKGVYNSGRRVKKPRISTCSFFKPKIRVLFFKSTRNGLVDVTSTRLRFLKCRTNAQ